MIPGEIRTGAGAVALNSGRRTRSVTVTNTGDRPVQIGSHLHLPDANPALEFDRESTRGFRINNPSGTSLRFDPGVDVEVIIVEFGGSRNWLS
ncbi:urease subunit beta [Streptomyces sulphureus]|uniref:urease subunit beta n=1 Tax=Streptomyces sulphureus TaxID=47758 RepID=UPI0009984338|nr:urease subunit beta [Streptomyces sulphureus]